MMAFRLARPLARSSLLRPASSMMSSAAAAPTTEGFNLSEGTYESVQVRSEPRGDDAAATAAPPPPSPPLPSPPVAHKLSIATPAPSRRTTTARCWDRRTTSRFVTTPVPRHAARPRRAITTSAAAATAVTAVTAGATTTHPLHHPPPPHLKTSACTTISRPSPSIMSALNQVPQPITDKFYGALGMANPAQLGPARPSCATATLLQPCSPRRTPAPT